MQAFTSLLCIGLIGNSLGLPRPQWFPSFGSTSISQDLEPGNVTNEVFINPKETTVASGSLESNDILEGTNLAGENSGIKQLPQLTAENMKQGSDISKNELIEIVKNITTQLGPLIKNESQIIISDLKETLTNVAKNLESLATKAAADQSSKQIGEHIKAMSDDVSGILANLSSAVQHELINKLGLEVMLKIRQIETTMGNIVKDVEKIGEKKHIKENIEEGIGKVINEIEEVVGKDSAHAIKTIAHVVSEAVSEGVERVEKLITGDNKDNKANNGPTENL
uniref:Methylaccepting chemotaxis sensory transducer-like protein n=1 Tax=Triatoma matogrossensis TaxID=162370 RepID=E2J7B2_9HEMI